MDGMEHSRGEHGIAERSRAVSADPGAEREFVRRSGLPLGDPAVGSRPGLGPGGRLQVAHVPLVDHQLGDVIQDRKSTRLNSSHVAISYAVFCLKKKKNSYSRK